MREEINFYFVEYSIFKGNILERHLWIVKKMVHYWCDDIKKQELTGKGVTVAVLDTGLAPHPDFKSRVVGWRDCIYRKKNVMMIMDMELMWQGS